MRKTSLVTAFVWTLLPAIALAQDAKTTIEDAITSRRTPREDIAAKSAAVPRSLWAAYSGRSATGSSFSHR